MSEAPDDHFSFAELEGASPALSSGSSAAPEPAAQVTLDAEATSRAQREAGQVSYHWSIATDTLTWSANASEILGCPIEKMSTGRQFATFLDSENFSSRYEAIMRSTQRDSGDGVPYEVEYLLRPQGKRALANLWIDDGGRWFADDQGAPCEAYGVIRVANARHVRDQQLNFLNNCDPLTGMMNRGRMADALGEAISVATTEKLTCAFAIVAVNNLNIMNETYGFEVADEVIVALGARLRKVMRVGDAIARYSGSKFGIILNGCEPEELGAALERFMRAVRDNVIETKLGPVWALVSIGAVSLPALGQDAATATAHAEEALSEALRLPADGYVIFTSSDERDTQRMLNSRCATEIVACLRDGLFKLAFQPVVDATTGEVVMHEALLRMQESGGEIITAGHLVPIAEDLGLIRLIDRAVLQLALETLQTYPAARLCVNISTTTANDPRWNVQLIEMLAAAPSLAARMVFEVVDDAKAGSNTTQQFIQRLKACGSMVALDDFGAAYTSFRNLKDLPVDMVKLDGTYCSGLSEGSENLSFATSLVQLAHDFGRKIVAEWVENEEDARVLRQLGVDFLQGNHLGAVSLTPPWSEGLAGNFEFAGAAQDAQEQTEEAPEPVSLVEEDAHIADQPELQDDAAPVAVSTYVTAVEAFVDEDEGETDAPFAEDDGMDASLSKLREALASLNQAFAPEDGVEDPARLAS